MRGVVLGRFAVLWCLTVVVGLGFAQETDEADVNVWDRQAPTVVICMLIRNKAHTLPYFLGYLEELDYPKDRLALFIRVDHSVDDSERVIRDWLRDVGGLYHAVDIDSSNYPQWYEKEAGPFDWPDERYRRVMDLRQAALDYARQSWADYIFNLDADVFLTNTRTLQKLISARRVAVAPLLKSSDDDYSSFFTGMDENSMFTIDDEFMLLYNRTKKGVWPIMAAHSAVLLDLRSSRSQDVTYDERKLIGAKSYKGLLTDTHILAKSLEECEARFYLLNDRVYGWILAPMRAGLTQLDYDVDNMRYLALESLYDGPPGLLHSQFATPAHPPPSKFGFDEIYVVNLKRRMDRLDRMKSCFDLLGIDAKIFDAVDGAELSDDDVASLGIRQMPEYRDPYHNRTMTRGEIGCFLSHYNIWREVLEKNYAKVLIFEDDLRFVRYFRFMLSAMFTDINDKSFKWDLIYLGRKRLKNDEPMVDGIRYLSRVGYSYWTLAYALSASGARKLMNAEPLSRLVPVDEYLPIMFDKHPEAGWMKHFKERNLLAFTAEPLFVFPIRYTGERGYVSDTENATLVDDSKLGSAKKTKSDEHSRGETGDEAAKSMHGKFRHLGGVNEEL